MSTETIAPPSPGKTSAIPPPKKVPPYRIEVRTAENPAAWWIIEFAHTPEQREAMLKRRQLEYGKDNAREANNGCLTDGELLLRYVASHVVAPLVSAVEFIAAEKLAKKFHEDKAVDITTLTAPEEIATSMALLLTGELPPGFPPPPPPVSVPAAAAAAMVTPPAPGDKAAMVDATAGVTPLPFDVGAVLEDLHTKAKIRVTLIHLADGTGRAFDWENLDLKSKDKTGTCPINSVGCFAIVSAHAKKSKKSKRRIKP